jgi:hypothetical protein
MPRLDMCESTDSGATTMLAYLKHATRLRHPGSLRFARMSKKFDIRIMK